MAERMIQANGVALCTEPFGDPADPPILLVMGIGGSMRSADRPESLRPVSNRFARRGHRVLCKPAHRLSLKELTLSVVACREGRTEPADLCVHRGQVTLVAAHRADSLSFASLPGSPCAPATNAPARRTTRRERAGGDPINS